MRDEHTRVQSVINRNVEVSVPTILNRLIIVVSLSTDPH